jgi:hypothetical protein
MTVRLTFQPLLFAAVLSSALPVYAADVCSTLAGAVVIAQDDENTYLGKVANAYDGKSIFNEYGDHGSQYSAKSIWNPYGKFGGEYSTHSPLNKYSSTPPMLVKDGKVLGYLSVNKSKQPSISPNLLKELCKDEL